MSIGARHELARSVSVRYRSASRLDKGRILDEFCAASGYSRKHSLRMVLWPPDTKRPRSSGFTDLSCGRERFGVVAIDWLVSLRLLASVMFAPSSFTTPVGEVGEELTERPDKSEVGRVHFRPPST